jgi:hypothetical protein
VHPIPRRAETAHGTISKPEGSVSGYRGHFAGPPAAHRARAALSNAQHNQLNKPNTDHQYREGERIVFEPTGNHGATLFKLISFKRLIGDRLTTIFDADQKSFLCESCAGPHRFMAPIAFLTQINISPPCSS